MIYRAEYQKQWRAKNRERIRTSSKNYYQRNKEIIQAKDKKYREEHREHCQIRHRLWYEKNKEKIKGQNKARKINEKIMALTHYSNGRCACVKCDESRLACLSIDHINGGGNKHRLSKKIATGNDFYRWLRQNNYPRGYQTLCMNCQFIKRYTNNKCINLEQSPFLEYKGVANA